MSENASRLVTYVPAVIENPLLWGQCRPKILTMRQRLLQVLLLIAALVILAWLFSEFLNGQRFGILIGGALTLLLTGIGDKKSFAFHRNLKFVVTKDTIYFNKRPPVPLNRVAHVSGRQNKVVLHRFGLQALRLNDVVEAERVRSLLTGLTT